MVEKWNSDGEKVEQCWWNSETVIVEQWNSDGGTAWWNSGIVCWNSGTVMVKLCGGTVEQ